MQTRLTGARRSLPLAMGAFALAAIVVLMAWDLSPGLFPARAHDVLGAFPLALIAFAYLAHQAVIRPARRDLVKAILLALAFLLWAANQLWPDLPQATLLNEDATIAGASYVLKLAPKTNTESTKLFKSMKVWVAEKDWSIRKIEYTDLNETTTVYVLSALQFDIGVPDDAFKFAPPANTEVVDLRKAPSPGN